MTTNNQQEISALCASVNEFSKEMKEELQMCALRGKRGWDKLSSAELNILLLKKIEEYNNPRLSITGAMGKLVDMANFSMMVHKALTEGR